MPLKDKIYLIGFMGSGKSTTGRRLAAGLGWYFIDLDRKIEEETGLRVPELFSRYGESGFRETEARVLKALRLFQERSSRQAAAPRVLATTCSSCWKRVSQSILSLHLPS